MKAANKKAGSHWVQTSRDLIEIENICQSHVSVSQIIKGVLIKTRLISSRLCKFPYQNRVEVFNFAGIKFLTQ